MRTFTPKQRKASVTFSDQNSPPSDDDHNQLPPPYSPTIQQPVSSSYQQLYHDPSDDSIAYTTGQQQLPVDLLVNTPNTGMHERNLAFTSFRPLSASQSSTPIIDHRHPLPSTPNGTRAIRQTREETIVWCSFLLFYFLIY